MMCRSAFALALLPLALSAQRAVDGDIAPLKNWPAPLYFQPTQTERLNTVGHEASVSGRAIVTPGLGAGSAISLVFVAITPCRVIDTRSVFGFPAPFGPPSLVAGAARSFPVRASTLCSIPATAQAYSLNVTVTPSTSAGLGFLTIWPFGAAQPNASTLNNPNGLSAIANAVIVPAGNDVSGSIQAYASNATDLIVDINGYYAPIDDVNGNVSIGVSAMPATTGGQNTAVGDTALNASTTGSFNSAFGYGSLQANTQGGLNTAVGNAALLHNTTGSNNTGVGTDAMLSNVGGGNNTAVGELALYTNASGSNNTAVGQSALSSNLVSGNTAVGQNALSANTTGVQNVAVGTGSLAANTTASYNAALGYAALQANTTGTLNTAVGNAALIANTGGSDNTAVGADALLANTGGANNTAVGELALYSNSNGIANTGLGAQALKTSGGNYNTGVGYDAALNLTIGGYNTAVGALALGGGAITAENTAIGYSALSAGFGNNNIAIGYLAGSNVTSANNTISIGSAGLNQNGAVSIGDNATDIFLGGLGTGTLNTYGTPYFPGIAAFGPTGTSLPVYVTSTTGQLSYHLSSRRYKDNIQDMGEISSGLLRLRPVTFRYKTGVPPGPEQRQYGLIAEEVAEIFPDLIARNRNGEVETLDYSELTPMLVNEVQKLNSQIVAKQNELQTQEQQIGSLQRRLEDLEAAFVRLASSAGQRP